MRDLFSLYLHIPFCEKRCNYCDFFSSTDSTLIDPFVNRLIEDIHFFYSEFDVDIDTLYIGGGTPSFISEKYIAKIFKNIDISKTREITIEVNPKSITKEKLDFYYVLGINRLSMGVQSFQNSLLKKIGRDSTRDINIEACEKVSKNWKGLISYDLINCISGQKKSELIEDIKMLSDYKAGHISVYNLTQNHKSLDMPEIEEATDQTLTDLGYNKYEISNYAKMGQESQHNLAYWNLDNFYGIGPSASGTFIKNQKHYRRDVVANLKTYIESTPDKAFTQSYIEPLDFAIDYLIMNSRLTQGISLPKYKKKCGYNLKTLIPETIKKWQDLNLLNKINNNLKFTKNGLLNLNQFLVEALNEIE